MLRKRIVDARPPADIHHFNNQIFPSENLVNEIYLLIKTYIFCTVSLLNIFKLHVLSSAYNTKLYQLEMLSTNNSVIS